MTVPAIRFRIGARTLLTLDRQLVRVPLSLDAVLAGDAPALPPLADRDDGYLITSLPVPLYAATLRQARGFLVHTRDAYLRHHADLTFGWDAYLARLSGSTRTAVRRKAKKWGRADLSVHRTPAELADFHARARPLSALTYQERLLDYGLPEDAEFHVEMLALAERDAVRAFLLLRDGVPAAYLYCPADDDTLIYDRLGHDPALAGLSPGAVLQAEALRLLMEEGRFARFDFTEGEGRHKRAFATGAEPCCDLLLLRPTRANRIALAALTRFDSGIALVKRAAASPRLAPLIRRLRRD